MAAGYEVDEGAGGGEEGGKGDGKGDIYDSRRVDGCVGEGGPVRLREGKIIIAGLSYITE